MEKVRPGTDREAGLDHGPGSAEQDAKAEGTNSRRLRRRRNNCRGCPERAVPASLRAHRFRHLCLTRCICGATGKKKRGLVAALIKPPWGEVEER